MNFGLDGSLDLVSLLNVSSSDLINKITVITGNGSFNGNGQTNG